MHKIVEKLLDSNRRYSEWADLCLILKKNHNYFNYIYESWQLESGGKPKIIKCQEMVSRVAYCILDDVDKTETAVIPSAL